MCSDLLVLVKTLAAAFWMSCRCFSLLFGVFFICLCVCLFVCFFSACLLTGAPGDCKAGFPTEALDCLLFCFYRCSSWLSGFSLFSLIVSFYFCSVSFSLLFLFPFSPSPVQHYFMLSIVTKVNK